MRVIVIVKEHKKTIYILLLIIIINNYNNDDDGAIKNNKTYLFFNILLPKGTVPSGTPTYFNTIVIFFQIAFGLVETVLNLECFF